VASPIYDVKIRDYNKFVLFRDYVEPRETFKELLQKVKETVIDGYKNQHYPIKKLLDLLGTQNNLSLFNVILLLENIHKKEFVNEIINDYENDIVVSFRGRDGDLECEITYNSLLLKEETIRGIGNFFIFILEQVLTDTSIKISHIELITAKEKKKIVHDFNDTQTLYPRDKTIQELFQEQVKKTPDSMAVLEVEKQHSLSYKDLNKWSNGLASLLRTEGVTPGKVVGIMVRRSLEMVVGILGILKAGAAYLPIDPGYPGKRITHMLEDSSVELLLSSARLKDRIVFNGKKVDLTLEELNFLPRANLDGVNRGNDPAYIIFTSGSTGKPKGVMVEHRSIVNTLYWRKSFYNFHQSDVILQIPSFSFDSSVEDIFTPLISGASLVLIPQEKLFDLEYLKNFLETTVITHFLIIPGFYRTLINDIPGCLRSLKSVTVAGESFTIDLVHEHFKRLAHVKLVNEYGPTENSVCTTVFEFNPHGTGILIGKPINNVSCFILNLQERVNPIGIPGELFISGPGLARGYLNRPGLTRDRFVGNPFSRGKRMYRTGDAARWTADGNIEFLGRIDQQVKIRGFRVELGEIEHQLQTLDEIKKAVVIAKDEINGEKKLYAYCVPAPPSNTPNGGWEEKGELNVSELRKKLIKNLPEYMVPSYFIQVDQVPVTPNGKIDRKALDAYGTKLGTGIEYEAPRSEREKQLAELWKEVLQVEKVGIHDNFFDLGGNSFFIIKLNSK
jgi:amino acid adenylation domain-containing protein